MTLWLFSVQPKGVAVAGEIDLTNLYHRSGA